MVKYRFKTEAEFRRDGIWNDRTNCPVHWNYKGGMNPFLGQPVPDIYQEKCDNNQPFFTDDGKYWAFKKTDYVVITEPSKSFWKIFLNKLGL